MTLNQVKKWRKERAALVEQMSEAASAAEKPFMDKIDVLNKKISEYIKARNLLKKQAKKS